MSLELMLGFQAVQDRIDAALAKFQLPSVAARIVCTSS